jgi:hypothetical protein
MLSQIAAGHNVILALFVAAFLRQDVDNAADYVVR